MAEVQTNTQTGELAQRFVEFVMMHAQNAALFLGQIPNPKTGEGEVNLELAKLFIDQLAMIQEKTRGNLTNEEAAVLRNAISNLQMAYVEVSQGGGAKAGGSPGAATSEQSGQPQPSTTAKPQEGSEQTISAPSESDPESKKKFTKSYGS
jgi:hypothetical protein